MPILVPEISISLAPPEDPVPEPFSPFSPTGPFAPLTPIDDDGFRPTLLTPPPMVSPMSHKQLSPLRPTDALAAGRGLERERFEALLRASKERNAALGGRKEVDLRKEIAIKAHKTKQVERRALFLSKVQAPPSPTAALTPKTPPESPAILHYTMPSPGMESPLEVFESWAVGKADPPACSPWVEQVEFRVSGCRKAASLTATHPTTPRKPLPSLEEISARMSGHLASPAPKPGAQPRSHRRLPAFLQAGKRSSQQKTPVAGASDPPASLPSHTFPLVLEPVIPHARELHVWRPEIPSIPSSPTSPAPPKIEVITMVVPRTASLSPAQLTESNVQSFATVSLDHVVARESTARNMLTRLRRRTLPPSASVANGLANYLDDEDRKTRRRSAPPELPKRERSGFSHPVLELPGAF
ncbi:hypothetical protein OBBRIDRAFT_765407 [Obba rivulosa]|uniref:Uncharacterized protein n=1 Tax=Obba rivulosa TaxID=1052685 RepID=A0A8E2DVH0_9APHY|nr:hypothetical protein OBBRIDRAFT_765407 [Obba rivulosa]